MKMNAIAAALMVCLCGGLAGRAVGGHAARNTTQLWLDFKLKYGKVYENEQVESERRQIFERNLEHIDEIKRQSVTVRSQNGSVVQRGPSYTVGINSLADLTDEEFARMNGIRWPSLSNWSLSAIEDKIKSRNYWSSEFAFSREKSDRFIFSILTDTSVEVPEAVDWRLLPGRVSAVKNQGQCGSCWAFATVGLLEGQQLVRLYNTDDPRMRLIDNFRLNVAPLSEQNLVDCDTWNFGCDGGFMLKALAFIQRQGGISSLDAYPYDSIESTDNPCRFKGSTLMNNIKGAAILPTGDEEVLRHVVAKYGPVAVTINSRGMKNYAYGVYVNDTCDDEKLNHAVLVVGYGTHEDDGDYWIVKNSWGTGWGEEGYLYLARNRNNMCGIASLAVIAIF